MKVSKIAVSISILVKTLAISRTFPIIPRLTLMLLKKIFPTVYLSTQEVIQSLTKDKDLQTVLGGNFGNFGDSPKTLPFLLYADMHRHYRDGGFYPVGGPGAITEAMVPVIQRAGGKVLVKADVTRVITDPS